MSAIFITGSGTDVGKTYITCGLLRHLRSRGIDVEASKPVLTGVSDATMGESDSAHLLAALGREVTRRTLDAISPWRFRDPLAPEMAAAREGRALDVTALIAHSRSAIAAQRSGVLAIEGVGGVYVPLDATHTVADWIDALSIPVVIVGGTYLGSLSHTLTALHVLLARGREVAAVVANESDDTATPLAETLATLARFTRRVPTIGIPRDARPEDPGFAALAALVTPPVEARA